MYLFEGATADDVWCKAATLLLTPDRIQQQPGRGGSTTELLHGIFSIQQPQQRWVLSRVPALNPAFAIAEIVWILRGRRDAQFLNFWNSQLTKYVGATPNYHGAYGYRLRHHFGIDQLERAFGALRNNPDGRQVVLQIWDAPGDLPTEIGEPVDRDIPCNVMSILKVRDQQLEWTQINRSNDLFKGVPYNFIQFTTIQEVLAGWLEISVGTYTHFSDSLHLYTDDIESLAIREIDPYSNTDSLRFPKAESDHYFSSLEEKLSRLIVPDLELKELETIAKTKDLPVAFHNLLLIAVAESARRRGWQESAEIAAKTCSNPTLSMGWQNWIARFSKTT